MRIAVTRLDPELPLPRPQHPDDAGVDLHARDDVVIPAAGGRALVATGIAIAVPPGHGGFVLPRSGLALANGVTCLNAPGLIDAQYRGEVKVLLVNTDPVTPYAVSRGDRIAQLVVLPVPAIEWDEVDELDDSTRDVAGFGSTGR